MNIAIDLDGTLISCEQRQMAVLQAALASYEARIDLERVWKLKRNGSTTEQALLECGVEPSCANLTAKAWRRMIEEPFWLELDMVFPEVITTLHSMRNAGATLYIITARNRPEWLNHQLEKLELTKFTDRVIAVETHDVVTAKSAALREIQCIGFFGDTELDWRASLEAEVPFYFVASGQRNATFLANECSGTVHRTLAEAWESLRTSNIQYIEMLP